MVRILGLDPSLKQTGWAVIDLNGASHRFVGWGHVTTSAKQSFAERVKLIYESISEVLDLYKPDEVAVEETFVNSNPKTTLLLGMARGVVLLAPAQKGHEVVSYSPNQVKRAMVGFGHADKEQMMFMVKRYFPQAPEPNSTDEADALAVAFCHAQQRQLSQSLLHSVQMTDGKIGQRRVSRTRQKLQQCSEVKNRPSCE